VASNGRQYLRHRLQGRRRYHITVGLARRIAHHEPLTNERGRQPGGRKGASTGYLLWRIYDLRGWYAGTTIRISENFQVPDRASNNRNVDFAAAGDGIECIF
jgi:hypothetical protein